MAGLLGCSLALDPRSTQCDSDRQCAALVENGREARCTAGYCQLLGDGPSASGAAGTPDAGHGEAGSAGAPDLSRGNGGNASSSGAPSLGGVTGSPANAGGESPRTTGGVAGASTDRGAGGGSTGATSLPAGGSGGAVGAATGGNEGAPAAPASTGGSDGVGAGGDGVGAGGDGVSLGGAAGQANSGDSEGEGGAGGSPESATAQGVMVLTVPLSATAQGQRYNAHNTGPVVSVNLAGATLTLRAYAPGATGGNLHVFYTSRNFADSVATDIALSRLTDGFQNIDVPVPAPVPDGFRPTEVFIIRVEVEAGADFGASWQVPATVVYLDSITSSNGVIADTFDTSPDFDTFGSSDSRTVPNSTLAWLPSVPVP